MSGPRQRRAGDMTSEEFVGLLRRRRSQKLMRQRRKAEFAEVRREDARRDAEIERWRRLCREAFGLPL